MTYASVNGRETVRMVFLLADLDELNILAGDIYNAYLNSETKEKILFCAGDEWRSNRGRIIVIRRALHGLKYSALMWRNYIFDVIGNKLGFKSSLSDPDLWMKASTTSCGSKYYPYILVYVDNILIMYKDPSKPMETLRDNYTVKPLSIGEPKLYLGVDVNKLFYPDGLYAWAMGSTSYTKAAINNVKNVLADHNPRSNKKLSDPLYTPMNPLSTQDYRSELDVSNKCDDFLTSYFKNLIWVLRWIV